MGAIAIAVAIGSLLFVVFRLWHVISLCRKALLSGAEFEATIRIPSFGLTVRTAPGGRPSVTAGDTDQTKQALQARSAPE
jgi:hypothetical protein